MVQVDNFSQIWERVKKSTDLSSYVQLANIVGTTHQYVSRKKAKDEFPAGWAFIIAQKYQLSTDWILTGQGPKRRSEEAPVNPLLIEVNEWLNEEGKQEDAEFRIFFRQQMIRAFFDYEKWIKKRKVSLGSGEDLPVRKIA